MGEQQDTWRLQGTESPSEQAWREVGRQFQALGETLAAAFRAAWEDEENQQRFQEVKGGLESMVKEVGQAIRETATTPEAQQARAEVSRAAASMMAAGAETMQEVRPHLVDALRQVNSELQKLIASLQESRLGQPPQGEGGDPEC